LDSRLRGNDREERLRRRRDFENRKTSEAEGLIHIYEVSLRRRREGSGTKRKFGGNSFARQRENAGRIHIWEVSLRGRRETSGAERLWENSFGKRRENSGE